MRLIETAAGATQRKIHYALGNDSGGMVGTLGSAETEGPDTTYVDIFKDLSLCNHRLYRQGRVPMVRIGFAGPLAPQVTSAFVMCQTLPNTWIVRKAHQLALKEYLRATKEERRRSGQARWHDFKVYYEDGQRSGTTLAPVGITLNNAEWNYSAITQDDGSTTRKYKFIGSTDSNCFGMVAEYDSQANTINDVPENPGGDVPYGDLHPDVQAANADALLDEGDFPPYNDNTLQLQEQLTIVGIGSGKTDKLVSEFFPAPCGLLKFSTQVVTSGDIGVDSIGTFFVEVMAGDYKGIHATPMGLKL